MGRSDPPPAGLLPLLLQLLLWGSLLAFLPMSESFPVPPGFLESSSALDEDRNAILASALINHINKVLNNVGTEQDQSQATVSSVSQGQPSPSGKVDIIWESIKKEDKANEVEASNTFVLASKHVPTTRSAWSLRNGESAPVVFCLEDTTEGNRNPGSPQSENSTSFAFASSTGPSEKPPPVSVSILAQSQSPNQRISEYFDTLKQAFKRILKWGKKKSTSSSEQHEESKAVETSLQTPTGAEIVVSVQTPTTTTANEPFSVENIAALQDYAEKAKDLLKNAVKLTAKEKSDFSRALNQEQEKADEMAATPSQMEIYVTGSPPPQEEAPSEKSKTEALINFFYKLISGIKSPDQKTQKA